MAVIDVHTHLDNDPYRETFQTAHTLVNRLDKYGMDASVIMPNPLDSVQRIEYPNNLILEAIRKYPNRLIGFCCVNPLFKARAVKEVERCLNLGFKGVGEIVADTWQIPADDELLISLIRSLDRFDVPILVHSSDTRYSSPEVIGRLVSEFPEKKMIIGHMGTWNRLVDEVISIAKRYKKVYLDTAFAESSEMIRKAIAELGAERILFGSDSFKDEELEKEMGKIKALNLTAREKRLIMGENAARLLVLDY